MPENATDSIDAYRRAGVDIAAGNQLVDAIKPLASATMRQGSRPDLGGFGGVFDLAACHYRDPLLVASTDGVGTKILLATQTGRLEGIGIDLVAMCVNDLVAQGAMPLFFLDYFATSKLEPKAATTIIAGIAEGCQLAGCALIGGETAEMPGLYPRGEFDLAGFSVGAVERENLLPKPTNSGDRILALSSSGIHSNGFSLVRKIVEDKNLHSAAPVNPGKSLAEILLEPTRIYVDLCRRAIDVGGVNAIAHITGGGLLENVPRALSKGQVAQINAKNWPLPPLFAWMAEEAKLSVHELARTFNCGIGMILIAAPDRAGQITEALNKYGETVYDIGEIITGMPQSPAIVELLNGQKEWPCRA